MKKKFKIKQKLETSMRNWLERSISLETAAAYYERFRFVVFFSFWWKLGVFIVLATKPPADIISLLSLVSLSLLSFRLFSSLFLYLFLYYPSSSTRPGPLVFYLDMTLPSSSIDGRLYRWHAVAPFCRRLTQPDVSAGPTRRAKKRRKRDGTKRHKKSSATN